MAERKVVEKVENATLYSDGTIKIENVRFSFPHIGTPQENEDDNGKKSLKYGNVAMLPKKTHVAAKNLVKSVIQKLMTDNDAKVANDKWFLADGDQKEQEEYSGYYVINASESKRPSARKRNGEQMTPQEADDAFYGGCWGNVFIRPWYFNGKAKNGKAYPKRICAGLVAVQFVRDDEPFGEGRINDDGVFDEVDEDDWNEGGDDDL